MFILITGATGQIGEKLISALKNSEHKIRILSRNSQNNLKDNKIESVIGDLKNLKSLEKATINIDTIIHLAAITHTNDQKLYYHINTEGTKNLLTAAEKNKVKNFIYISSRTAGIEGGAYAHSKLLAEELVKKSSLNWVILRPSEVYGANDKEAISKLINIIKKNPIIPIIGDGKYCLNPVHIDDLIQTISIIVNKNIYSRKTYIIAGPKEISYNDLVDKLAKKLKVKIIKIHIPIFFARLIAYLFFLFKKDILVRDQVPRLLSKKPGGIEEARKDLGFKPRNLEAGLK